MDYPLEKMFRGFIFDGLEIKIVRFEKNESSQKNRLNLLVEKNKCQNTQEKFLIAFLRWKTQKLYS